MTPVILPPFSITASARFRMSPIPPPPYTTLIPACARSEPSLDAAAAYSPLILLLEDAKIHTVISAKENPFSTQISALSFVTKEFFGTAPTCLSATLPPLKKSTVGIFRILYFMATDGLLSTSHLTTRALPSNSREISSMMGAIILHGPHHSAQKS